MPIKLSRSMKDRLNSSGAAPSVEECEWRELLRYGEERAREKGIGPEDVAGLVEEYRAEVGSSRT